MPFARTWRHLVASRARTRRRFPAPVLQSIEAAIVTAEKRTSGEIRFVIETALDGADLWAGLTPRDARAAGFRHLRLWDTELRNGVLIYVLMADRDVEIVADRGAAAVIPAGEWEQVCRLIEDHFHEQRFAAGAAAGVEAVGQLLAKHFPGDKRDELPNQPALL